MTVRHRRLPRLCAPGAAEEGIALIAALIVIFVLSIIGSILVSISLHSLNAVTLDRTGAVDVAAAEAGLDNSIAQIQNASSTLPCKLSGSLTSGPLTSNWSATIVYYNSVSPFTDITNCGPPASDGSAMANFGSATPGTAEITSTGSANTAGSSMTRAMRAKVTLTPVGAFTDALFANSNISFGQTASLTGSPTESANVYVGGPYTCANQTAIGGSLYVQGDITFSNKCSVTGDAWAKNGISASTGSTGYVGGSAYAGNGAISLVSGFNVNQTAMATGSITCASVKQTCTQFAAPGPGNPPSQTFPHLDYAPNAFPSCTAGSTPLSPAGCYTVVGVSDCPTFYTDMAAMATSTQNTVFVVRNCPIDWADKNVPGNGSGSWQLAANVVVYSDQGMQASQKTDIVNVGSTMHDLYMIVPYDMLPTSVTSASTTTPVACPAPGTQFPTTASASGYGYINMANNVTISVPSFVYAPCDVQINNSTTMQGQVYSGKSLTIGQSWTMQYLPLPVNGVSNTTSTAFNVALNYVREQ